MSTIQAIRVAANRRMGFLQKSFGNIQTALRGESAVFDLMRQFSADYNGGEWIFYNLSNFGFYLAPKSPKSLLVRVDGNGFEDRMSADAAGVVVTLFILNSLANRTQRDDLIEKYHCLLDFAKGHPEARLILQAID